MGRCTKVVQLGDYLVDTSLVREYFSCDLSLCGGACCVEGSDGAPLTHKEVEALEEHREALAPHLSEGGRQVLMREGVCYRDGEGEWVTTLQEGGTCAFAVSTKLEGGGRGVLCAIEKVRLSVGQGGVLEKPISCALYPIRVWRQGVLTALRYDRWSICDGARIRGEALGVKVYEFVRAPLIRAFGESFYQELQVLDRELSQQKIA